MTGLLLHMICFFSGYDSYPFLSLKEMKIRLIITYELKAWYLGRCNERGELILSGRRKIETPSHFTVP